MTENRNAVRGGHSGLEFSCGRVGVPAENCRVELRLLEADCSAPDCCVGKGLLYFGKGSSLNSSVCLKMGAQRWEIEGPHFATST
jgi:hypothetical protein